jgi:aspartate/methionine/tyrosine aminotransferase
MELNPVNSKDIIDMRNKFRERRDLMFKLLQDIPNINVILPQGAFISSPK